MAVATGTGGADGVCGHRGARRRAGDGQRDRLARCRAGRARATAQPVNVIDAEQISIRSRSVVAQAVAEETGVHLLRTSPTVAGIYVRGLTGNKVNVFVDGVRYSTSAQRGGINTFLDLVEPTTLQGIEVLRGPSSAQYGSDALGGSVQFLPQTPSFSSGSGRGFHGLFSAKGGTAGLERRRQPLARLRGRQGRCLRQRRGAARSTTSAPATGSTRTRRSRASSA